MALTDDLIAWWDFDDETDSHTGGHDLTENNGPHTYSSGKVTLVRSDQDSFSIANASASAFDPGTSDATISVWVNPTGTPTEWLYRFGTFGSDGISIRITSGGKVTAYIEYNSGTRIEIGSVATLSTSTLYHLLIIYDRDGDATLYINGSLDRTVDISDSDGYSLSATSDLGVGGVGGNSLDGDLHQESIWHRALSGAEVTELYNSGTVLEYSDLGGGNTSLLAYGGGATSSVLHKVGLSSILSYEGAASGSLTHALGLKALATYEGGATGSATHSAGLIASVVANHQAGATSSVQHKSGRVSVVTHQGDTNISNTYVTGRVAVVNHEGDVSYRVLHITARQARASHEAGAIYSALTQELAVPSCIELSIEHLNKITLTIEKVS